MKPVNPSRRQLLVHCFQFASVAAVAVATVGCGGGLGAALAVVLFCTPVGALLAIAAGIGATIWIYKRFEGDDHHHDHPPIQPCPPPPPPPPPENILVYFYNEVFPSKSQCPVMRISAKRAGSSDRPVWIFDAHQGSPDDQTVDMDPARMSYPTGFDAIIDGNRMIGSELLVCRVFFDTDGDGSGNIWMTEPGLVEFEIWYGNGDHLVFQALLSGGTTTIKHGWMPEGIQIYSVQDGPLAVQIQSVRGLTAKSSDVVVDGLLAPEAVIETMASASRGEWVPIGSAYLFMELAPV